MAGPTTEKQPLRQQTRFRWRLADCSFFYSQNWLCYKDPVISWSYLLIV